MLVAQGVTAGVGYEVALRWHAADLYEGLHRAELSFVNGEPTPDGGTHRTGFRSAVARAVNIALRRQGAEPLAGADTREGLYAVVAVRLADPQYSGAVRDRVLNPEVRAVVQAAVGRLLADRFAAEPTLAAEIAANTRGR